MGKSGKTPTSLRMDNTKLVLKTILSSKGPPSRADVSASTGLTRATVSRLVDSLLDYGIISELPPVKSAIGRPAAPLVPRTARHAVVGCEVNVAYLSVAVMDLSGKLLYSQIKKMSTRHLGPSGALKELEKIYGQWKRPKAVKVLGAGLCVPGLIADDGATVLTAPNLGWTGVQMKELSFAQPRCFEGFRLFNEADAAGYSVLHTAPGKVSSYRDFLYVSGEVGVGAAVYEKGRRLGGSHGWAGEFGHVCVDRSGPKCNCGSNGCLEQYVGESGLVRNAGLPEGTELSKLIELFREGSETARDAMDAGALALGLALANTLNLLDLDTVFFGGTFVDLYPCFETILKAELKYRVLSSHWKDIELIVNRKGEISAAIGACLWIFNDLIEDLSGFPGI